MSVLQFRSDIQVETHSSKLTVADTDTEMDTCVKNSSAMQGISHHQSSTTLIGDLELENVSNSYSAQNVSPERETPTEQIESSCTFLELSSSVEVNEFPVSLVVSEEKPMDNVILPPDCFSSTSKSVHNYTRHGISRYAPYGTRFAAKMKDGTLKTSHVAGDLANRQRVKNNRGSRVDLILATHEGERYQLDSALAFYENSVSRHGPSPGPSEVLYHLKELEMDWDYRKGDGIKLLQRNASNFFKRMMEHAKRIRHPVAVHFQSSEKNVNLESEDSSSGVEKEISDAARILQRLTRPKPSKKLTISVADVLPSPVSPVSSNEFQINEFGRNPKYDDQASFYPLENYHFPVVRNFEDDDGQVHTWSEKKYTDGSFYSLLCEERIRAYRDEIEYYREKRENFDWSSVQETKKRDFSHVESFDYEDYQLPLTHARKKPKQKVAKIPSTPRNKQQTEYYESQAITTFNPTPVLKKSSPGSQCIRLKGLSRHSPYGTRFCARMKSGELKESFLAGDLAERAKSPSGKHQSELTLVTHEGEITQLETAWNYLMLNPLAGASAVMDLLRELDIDYNYRKGGSRLLQKNAGNFFKRVQEYGRRKTTDPDYLSLQSEIIM